MNIKELMGIEEVEEIMGVRVDDMGLTVDRLSTMSTQDLADVITWQGIMKQFFQNNSQNDLFDYIVDRTNEMEKRLVKIKNA